MPRHNQWIANRAVFNTAYEIIEFLSENVGHIITLATISVYKCSYKFGLGDTNVWMLDSINVWIRVIC